MESGNLQLEAVRKAAVALSVAMEMLEIIRPSDFELAFQAAARSQSAGVLMRSSPLFGGNPQLLADLALQNRLPAINIFPDFAKLAAALVEKAANLLAQIDETDTRPDPGPLAPDIQPEM